MSKYLCGSLSVCMFVCMYVCMYVRMYVCTYVCTHVRMYVCLSVCMCVCLSVCLSVAEEQRGDCININVESADSEYSTLYLSPFHVNQKIMQKSTDLMSTETDDCFCPQ